MRDETPIARNADLNTSALPRLMSSRALMNCLLGEAPELTNQLIRWIEEGGREAWSVVGDSDAITLSARRSQKTIDLCVEHRQGRAMSAETRVVVSLDVAIPVTLAMAAVGRTFGEVADIAPLRALRNLPITAVHLPDSGGGTTLILDDVLETWRRSSGR